MQGDLHILNHASAIRFTATLYQIELEPTEIRNVKPATKVHKAKVPLLVLHGNVAIVCELVNFIYIFNNDWSISCFTYVLNPFQLQMLTPDLWSIVVQHVDCTQTLFNLRLVNKAFNTLIPLEAVIGATSEVVSVLCKPKISKYEPIQIGPNEDLEGVLSQDGTMMWSWVNSNPIRLTQYDASNELICGYISKNITTLATLREEYLWIGVADNGLICLLKNTPDEPLFLSVMRHSPKSEVLSLVMATEIERRRVMRRSIFQDEPEEYLFSRNSLQCITWNDRTLIMMLPIDQRDTISFLEIEPFHKNWITCQIPCGASTRLGCIRQVKNLIYIVPARVGCVYTIDLNDTNLHPILRHTLPELPNGISWFTGKSGVQEISIASMMEVSENGDNFIVSVSSMKQVFHLTKSAIRPLDKFRKLDISACSVLGNTAAICFMMDSSEYRLYNLKTKDFVKAFQFAYTPFFSLMRNNCIWSMDSTMAVYRQIAQQQC
jgi:hypothetical protein